MIMIHIRFDGRSCGFEPVEALKNNLHVMPGAIVKIDVLF